MRVGRLFVAMGLLGLLAAAGHAQPSRLTGEIVDADSGRPLAARLYIRAAAGEFHVAESADAAGSAVAYRVQRGGSREVHTTLSAHPFVVELPPGKYELVAERGKETLPAAAVVTLGDGRDQQVTLRLKRWIDLQKRGWYSGDTHVHRALEELPNLLLAEDLNVALPLTYWVTQAHTAPTQGDKNSAEATASVVDVDATHVFYPMNTEYEIFTVDGQRHTLGAVFALNHRQPLTIGVPPVGPVAEQVHREGGLLELDKHNWPWSMMLVPVMNVDLYELSNNHVWRTDFLFRQFGEPAAEFMQVEQDDVGFTERGWIDFTWRNYYTLLNCGFRLRPTAGTASGVHPVPLGFGRVYVQVEGDFRYEKWMQGLDAGRSFVTTGPLLETLVNDRPTAAHFVQEDESARYRVSGWARSILPLTAIDVVASGEVIRKIEPENRPRPDGGYETRIDETLEVDTSTWLAVRCWEATAEGRPRFAHSAPSFIDVAGKPLRPRRAEIGYLIDRVERQLERNRDVLPEAALAEYKAALEVYRQIAASAR